MAKKICGEASLKIGARTVRLRLDIGTMIDLEDYFDMGLVPFLAQRFPECRLKDIAILFVAMTKGDFTDEVTQRKAAETVIKYGLADVATAVSSCLEATLTPSDEAPGK